MKTKIFLIGCLLLGMFTSRIFSQFDANPPDNKNVTGTVESWRTWDSYYAPVFSDNGELIDWIGGIIIFHNLDHFKNGVWIWRKQDFFGEVESVSTGEAFRIMDHWTWVDVTAPASTGHFNAVGDQGSHYIITYYCDAFTLDMSCLKVVSPSR